MPRPRGPYRRIVLRGALGLVLQMAASHAPAAEQTPDLTSLSLEELAQTKVTSVSKSEEPRFLAPAAIHVLTNDDLRLSGVQTFAEALRLAPGVHVARINTSQWAVGIRGFTDRLARAQLALLDGRSLYNPLFAGTYWEAQDAMLEDVDRVEIVRGPGGTLWGANAVNGIVNIITRSAADTQGGFITAGAGNEERGFVRARHGGRIGSRAHYRVYGKYFSRDASFHETPPDFDDWHQAQAGFRTDLALGEDTLTVRGGLVSGKAGQRSSTTFYTPPFTRITYDDAEFSGGNLAARWNRAKAESQTTIHAYYDRSRRAEAIFEEVRDTVDAEVQYQRNLGARHRLLAGLGYRLSAGRGIGIETVGFRPPNRTDHIASAFVHHETDFAQDRVRLAVGLKVERNQYTGFELQPSARAVWSPAPRHALWAAVTRAVRTPSRVERDLELTVATSATLPVFARVIGNEGFESEEVVAYESGYRLRPWDRLSLELAGFHNRYDSLLGIMADTPFREGERTILPFRLANTLRGRSSGVEVASIVQPRPHWILRGEYSYLNLDLEPRPGSPPSSEAAEGSAPRHMLMLRSLVTLPRDVTVHLSYRWLDDLPAQNVPSYASLNARVGVPVGKRLELAVAGRDLLQDHHPEFGAPAGRSEIQRSVFAEATWRW
jgi:iron complex outermembrane receptor protein